MPLAVCSFNATELQAATYSLLLSNPSFFLSLEPAGVISNELSLHSGCLWLFGGEWMGGPYYRREKN